MKEIKQGETILARHILSEDIQQGLNFFSNEKEYLQVGVWGNYDQGQSLTKHIHREFDRVARRTYEVLYVMAGSVEASIYDLNENLIDKIYVRAGEVLILMECGHGYRILENNTTVLEVKNGPYMGAEQDRYRF